MTVALTGLIDVALDGSMDADDSHTLVASKQSEVVKVLSAAVNAVLQAPRLELTQSTTIEGSCSELIDAVAVATTMPGEIEVFDLLAPVNLPLGIATVWEGDPMWAVSMQRLGYRYCSVMPPPNHGQYATTVVVAPGGSWAFDQSEAQTVDGLGLAVSECVNTIDGPYCVVGVAVGDTLVSVMSYEATPVISLAIAKVVVAHLG